MIGLGAVGLGRGFMLTLPALLGTPGMRLVAACDPRQAARQQFTMAYGGRAYKSLEELLRDPEVTAVYIASPHELHAAQTVAAASAGKHVLVEKPMATTIADCQAMVAAARAAGVVLLVGPSHGFDGAVQRAAALVASGSYGKLRLITTFNFTDFVYRPRRPEELDPAKGGGVVFSQAAHQFDVVRRIAGPAVTHVTAVASNWDRSRGGDGAYAALVRFASGAAATLTYSGYAHYDSDELLGWISELGRDKDPSNYGDARRRLANLTAGAELEAKVSRTLGGSEAAKAEKTPTHNEHFGFLLVSCERADLKVMPNGVWVFADHTKEFIAVPPPAVPRAAAIAEFIDAIGGKGPKKQDGEWGLETVRCCVALIRSSASGGTSVAVSEPGA
jgi:phthalate 4,5-cis-dihydrodiol dehydrogenase